MLTIIENDQEHTVRVHSSACKDIARDSAGRHIFITQVASKDLVLETVADNQCAEIEDIEASVKFLPCCNR